ELALGWWRRAILDPAHHGRIQNVDRTQAAWCCQRLGRLADAAEILKPISGNQVVTIAGPPLPVEDAGTGLPPNVPEPDSTTGTPPALGRPLWRGILTGEHSRHIEALARAWEAYQLQSGLPVGTAQAPLLVGQRLIYRDFEGLRAVDLRTGTTAWYYPCESTICREIPARPTIPAEGT